MKKPNIVFLIQDQMQEQVLRESSGCIMPNLRALMADSINFRNAHTCNAICSPARASLMTGVLPHVHGMVDCTHTVPAYRAEYDETLDMLTRALHDCDYHVSYFGKWHIERSNDLSKFGIDRFETEVQIPGFHVTMEDRVVLKNPGYTDKTVCGIFAESAECTEEHYIYQKALADIEESRKGDKPFCTFISTYAPHDPYCVPREVYDLYEHEQIELPASFDDPMEDKPAVYRRMRSALSPLNRDDFKEAKRCYYSYCTLVDIQIGKLMSYLKENGLYEDTLIVCTSDHGDMQGAHGMMMKSVECFEEIYHIPLVMKFPKREYAGAEMTFPVSTCEIAATVLDIAGCRSLKGSHIGESVMPWVRGERNDPRFSMAEFFGQRYSFTQRIIWKDSLKYVFNAFDNDELYDLKADPLEMHNLNEDPAYQEKKVELCTLMWEQIKAQEDDSLADAEYFLMRFAPIGPGVKKQKAGYSLYNKSF